MTEKFDCGVNNRLTGYLGACLSFGHLGPTLMQVGRRREGPVGHCGQEDLLGHVFGKIPIRQANDAQRAVSLRA